MSEEHFSLHRDLVTEIFTALFQMSTKGARIKPLPYMLISKGCYSILNQRSFWKAQAITAWARVFSQSPIDFPFVNSNNTNFMKMTWDLNQRFLECWHIHACGDILGSYQEAWTGEHEKTQDCSHPECTHKSVWRCITQDCLFIGCSRMEGAHALLHYETTRHPISVNAGWSGWCYECDTWVGSKVLELKKLADAGATKKLKIKPDTISETNWCTIS